MRVQDVKLEKNQRRYLLVDNTGLPIIPVAKYLKYIDNNEKTYCYFKKLYFEYLRETGVDYKSVNITYYLTL